MVLWVSACLLYSFGGITAFLERGTISLKPSQVTTSSAVVSPYPLHVYGGVYSVPFGKEKPLAPFCQ